MEAIANERSILDAAGQGLGTITTGPLGKFNQLMTFLDVVLQEAIIAMTWLFNNVIGPILGKIEELDSQLVDGLNV